MRKRISIVFEETDADDGAGFNVFLEGFSEERRKAIRTMSREEQLEKLSRAEFWALRCFEITVGAINQTGAIRTVQKKG